MYDAYDPQTGEYWKTDERFAQNGLLFAHGTLDIACEHCGGRRHYHEEGLDDRAEQRTTVVEVVFCVNCDGPRAC